MEDAKQAVIRYFKIHKPDAKHLGSVGNFEVFDCGAKTTFVHVVTSDDDFVETPYRDLRRKFEKAMIPWSIERAYELDSSFIITCDEACVVMLNKDRALIRNTVNVFNKEV